MFRVITLSLMLAWPVQPAAQVTLRTTANVMDNVESRAAVSALEPEEASEDLSDYLGVSRPVVVFADAPDDPRLQEQLQMLSIRVDQGRVSDHSRPSRRRAFAMTTSLRMTAVRATFAGFPARTSCSYFAFRSVLKRVATRAGM